jgi:membrane fusion protein, multidrug efflux system
MEAERRAEPHGPPIELVLADGRVYPEPGRFALPDREVDVKTGTITLVSYFSNPKNILRPGLYAKVRTVTETKNGALLVPQRAVQELQGNYRVAVVGADNKVVFRTVKTGTRFGNRWVIDDGLKLGEHVIVEGLQKVREGMPVNPQPVPAEPEVQKASTSAAPAEAATSTSAKTGG